MWVPLDYKQEPILTISYFPKIRLCGINVIVLYFFRKEMFRKPLKISLLICFILWMGLLCSCGSRQAEKPEERSVRVEVVPVRKGNISKEIKFTGSIEAYAEVQVYPKITAKIEALKVDMGDLVQKDDLLALLESDELRAQVKQAEAALHNLQAKWRQI